MRPKARQQWTTKKGNKKGPLDINYNCNNKRKLSDSPALESPCETSLNLLLLDEIWIDVHSAWVSRATEATAGYIRPLGLADVHLSNAAALAKRTAPPSGRTEASEMEA